MRRADRLADLVELLQTRTVSTTTELAAELGVAVRTVLRDLAALRESGLPVVTERGRFGGVSLLPGTRVHNNSTRSQTDLQPARLTFARPPSDVQGTRDPVPATRSNQDSSSQLGQNLANLLPDLAQVVRIENPMQVTVTCSGSVAQLAADLRQQRRLSVSFRKHPAAALQTVTLDPYGLLLRTDRWYLIADLDSRPFVSAVERIENWVVLEESRRLRHDQTLYTVGRELAEQINSTSAITVSGLLDENRIDLAVRILGNQLLKVGATPEPGRLSVAITFKDLSETRKLAQIADCIVITSPPEVRELLAQLARRYTANHPGILGASAIREEGRQ